MLFDNVETGTIMHLLASGSIYFVIFVEGDDSAHILEWSHAEQNLTIDGQSICTDPDSASGPIWARFVYMFLRIAKNGNQNVCEMFWTLGLNADGKCTGSAGGKTVVYDGKKYAEFIFNRRFAALLSQMAVSHPVKGGGQSSHDMPVFHAPQMEAKGGVQAHRKGVWWSIMSHKQQFDEVLDLVGQMPRPSRANVTAALMDKFPIKVVHRVNMSNDTVIAGCHREGHASFRIGFCAKDIEGEVKGMLSHLWDEMSRQTAFLATSVSHSVLDMLGGRHLLALWKTHQVCSMSGQKLCYQISAPERDRLLSFDSPTSLTDSERSLWCVVHALQLSGIKNIGAVQALNSCLSNLVHL